MKILLFVFFSCFSYVFSSQFCYDCSPSDAGNCLEPEKNNIKHTNCGSNVEINLPSTPEPLEFQCFTLLTQNGTYRGCYDSRKEVCNNLKITYTQYEVLNCFSCSNDNCNNQNLLKTGETEDDGGNGTSERASISILILNVALLAHVFWNQA